MLAGLVTAARIGFELPNALEIAEKTYVDVNIHDAKNAAVLNSLAQLPTSCAESADELDKNRALYEAKGVFSKSMIDGRIAMLRAYNDANIREEVKLDKGLMMELVRRYYHCG